MIEALEEGESGRKEWADEGTHQCWQAESSLEESWDMRQPTSPQPLWKSPESAGGPHLQ